MTEPHLTRTPIRVGPGLAKAMDASSHPLQLPQSKAEFNALVAQAEAGLTPVKRGRPAKGERRAATETHSLRLPAEVWQRLTRAAKRRHLTTNAAAALALATWAQGEVG